MSLKCTTKQKFKLKDPQYFQLTITPKRGNVLRRKEFTVRCCHVL